MRFIYQSNANRYTEGAPTIVIAFLAYFYLPGGPGHCPTLDVRQNEIVATRARKGRGHEEEGKLNYKQAFAAFYDYKNYLQAAIIFCLNVSISSLIKSVGDVILTRRSDCFRFSPCFPPDNHPSHRIHFNQGTGSLRPSLPTRILHVFGCILPRTASVTVASSSRVSAVLVL